MGLVLHGSIMSYHSIAPAVCRVFYPLVLVLEREVDQQSRIVNLTKINRGPMAPFHRLHFWGVSTAPTSGAMNIRTGESQATKPLPV
jgi:hypothetical protein